MKTSRVRKRLESIVHRLAPREHRRLRRTGYHFAIADAIDQLNPAAWDAAAADSSLFLSRSYLNLLERHRPANLEPRYALVSENGAAIAAIACQVVTLDAERVGRRRTTTRRLARALAPAVDQLKGVVRERVLVCGNLLTWGQHAVALSPRGRLDVARTWSAVAEALYRIRRIERVAGGSDLSMIKDFDLGSLTSPSLTDAGFRRVETEPNMALAIDGGWKSHDDYLAALDGKYRKSARQIFKEVADSGATVERCHDIAPLADEFHRLYMAVQANNVIRPVATPSSYLVALAETFPDDFRATVIRREGALLGFVVTIRDGESAIGYHIGFDREAAQTAPLYLRLLHAVVADAIDLGCRRLSLGRTALEPKARLGARPEPMEMWVKHRTGGLNFVLGNLLASIDHAEAPERNPFKKVKA